MSSECNQSAAKLGPDHYRYFTVLDEIGVTVRMTTFTVVGETPCCYYVVRSDLVAPYWDFRMKRLRKRVLKDSYRRYCYPDKADALRSFKIRQKWRLEHAARSMATAELALAAVAPEAEADTAEPKDSYFGGQNDYTSSLSWAEY